MEVFDRTKAILFNPKEEWVIIEAENEPHVNVLIKYLVILALIPAVAIFISYWWQWNSATTGLLDFFSSPSLKWIIAMSIQQSVIVVGGAYVTAAIINAFSDQFGSAKDLNRTFSLVAYSYTPLCVAGILYIYSPLAFLIPLAGCYGLYLLYLGIEPQLKPAIDKKTTCIMISLIAVIVVWAVLSKIVPTITQTILIEQAKSSAGDTFKNLEKMIPR